MALTPLTQYLPNIETFENVGGGDCLYWSLIHLFTGQEDKNPKMVQTYRAIAAAQFPSYIDKLPADFFTTNSQEVPTIGTMSQEDTDAFNECKRQLKNVNETSRTELAVRCYQRRLLVTSATQDKTKNGGVLWGEGLHIQLFLDSYLIDPSDNPCIVVIDTTGNAFRCASFRRSKPGPSQINRWFILHRKGDPIHGHYVAANFKNTQTFGYLYMDLVEHVINNTEPGRHRDLFLEAMRDPNIMDNYERTKQLKKRKSEFFSILGTWAGKTDNDKLIVNAFDREIAVLEEYVNIRSQISVEN
jgi:hypothetical protein